MIFDRMLLFKSLLISIVIAVIGVLIIGQHPTMHGYLDIGWLSIGGFTLLTVVLYLLGSVLTQLSNQAYFITFVQSLFFIKLLFALGMVWMLKQAYQPSSRFFIFHFIWVYITFTVVETYLFLKLSYVQQARTKTK